MALFCGIHEKYAMWKFIVDVVHDFGSSLQPDVGRGFLHVSNVLYIELVLVCCRNPDNVHCFGIIFQNVEFVFASICAACLVPMQSDKKRSCSTVKWRGGCHSFDPDGEKPKTALWLLSSRNDMISVHQRSTWMNEGKIKLIWSYCVMNVFFIFSIMFMMATALEN